MPAQPLLAAYVVRLFGHPGRIDGVELHDLCRGDTHKHETLHAALTCLHCAQAA